MSSELKKYNVSKFILKKLETQKLCRLVIDYKKSVHDESICQVSKKFFLSTKLLKYINALLTQKSFSSFLLTKSSLYVRVKFYLGLIRLSLYKNMQILILVPYIKNINIILFFLKKFFNVSIEVIHSKLTHVQYLKNWIKIKDGEISIVIGTKNSIFLPFVKLGLIIILEEHHLNYKNMDTCRYNVRDIGILRAYKENILIILDSNTPSLKTLHNILLQKCFYLKIKRHDDFIKFRSHIIDTKKERLQYGFSISLIDEINNNFEKKQALLIFNKYNLFFSVLICMTCKFIFQCNSCNNDFEVNKYQNILLCKFCLIKIEKPVFCYNCQSLSLIILKRTIEEIKYKIQKIFPKQEIFLLLNHTHIDKHLFYKNSFMFNPDISCIILVNEEIVQNYYFPHVQLIGLINLDNCFLSYDFRAIEYFSQFYINLYHLTRYNRISLKVFLQTSFANNVNLKELYKNGYFSLSKKMLNIRKYFLLPPWSVHSIIYSESVVAEKNIIFLNFIHHIIKKRYKKYDCLFWFIGPHPSLFVQKNKKYIAQLLVQCSSRICLHHLLNECMDIVNLFSISKTVKWFIDIEPN